MDHFNSETARITAENARKEAEYNAAKQQAANYKNNLVFARGSEPNATAAISVNNSSVWGKIKNKNEESLGLKNLKLHNVFLHY